MENQTPLRHGAYVCFSLPESALAALAAAPIPELAARLGLSPEFESTSGHPEHAIAFLRGAGAAPADLADEALRGADAIVHVASSAATRIDAFCAEAERQLATAAPYVLRGVVKPNRYTGGAMHEFAYAHQVAQQPGRAMPNAFLVPLRKTAEWWAKDWMERHTHILPRYDESGRMTHQGHALAAAAGIPCLMRRTYKHAREPAPEGEYDFLTYFECADADIATFRAVRDALRDVRRNPEWRFVREGSRVARPAGGELGRAPRFRSGLGEAPRGFLVEAAERRAVDVDVVDEQRHRHQQAAVAAREAAEGDARLAGQGIVGRDVREGGEGDARKRGEVDVLRSPPAREIDFGARRFQTRRRPAVELGAIGMELEGAEAEAAARRGHGQRRMELLVQVDLAALEAVAEVLDRLEGRGHRPGEIDVGRETLALELRLERRGVELEAHRVERRAVAGEEVEVLAAVVIVDDASGRAHDRAAG